MVTPLFVGYNQRMVDFDLYLLLAFFGLLFTGVGILFIIRPTRKLPNLPYTTTPILTATEIKFFLVLQKAIPQGCYVLAQVRLANIVKVKYGTPEFWKHFARIGMKCVDFVIVEYPSIKTLLVVELDDRTHDREDRRERDGFVDDVLYSAGVPILHVPTSFSYNVAVLSQAIRNACASASGRH
jgi:hypothetical protein